MLGIAFLEKLGVREFGITKIGFHSKGDFIPSRCQSPPFDEDSLLYLVCMHTLITIELKNIVNAAVFDCA